MKILGLEKKDSRNPSEIKKRKLNLMQNQNKKPKKTTRVVW
jgi:hypothetical protein